MVLDASQLIRLLKADLRETEAALTVTEEELRQAMRSMRALRAKHEALRTLIQTHEPEFDRVGTFRVSQVPVFTFTPAEPVESEGAGEPENAERPGGQEPAETIVEQQEVVVTPEDLADEIARENRGVISVQTFANRLFATGNYRSESSAYGSAHSQLARNPKYEKVGRGTFRLKPVQAEEEPPV